MKSKSSFVFPVASFRNIDTPFQKQGYRNYLAVIDIHDLPDFSEWRRINVRDPKLTGAIPKAIRDSVHSNEELFVFMSRGIVIAAESATFDNKTSKVTLTLSDPALHGLLDGGHTYNILIEESASIERPQFVKIEILEGFKQDDIPSIVEARNTSNQVKDQSLMNLQGEFEKLKKAIAHKPYAHLIGYKEYEILDDEGSKPIDVRDVVAILTCFDRANFDSRVHPINAYRSKAACLDHFRLHQADFDKVYPLAGDILELYDEIQLQLPELYNRVRSKNGGGGKFGKLTGVATYTDRRRAKLLFTGKESKYGVPSGFVYPMLGAFRALLEESKGKYVWGKRAKPIDLLHGELGEQLADTIGNFALDARNPSKTGKSPLVWQACYQAAQVYYLELSQ